MSMQGGGPFVVATFGGHVVICDPAGRPDGPTFVAKRGSRLVPLSSDRGPAPDSRLPINILANADFSDGITCWRLCDADHKHIRLAVDFRDEWILSDTHTAYIRVPEGAAGASAVYVDPVFGEYFPIRARDAYKASGYFGLHRCNGRLSVEVFDEEKKPIESHAVSLNPAFAGGRRVEGYDRASLDFITPAHAAFARLVVTYL